MIGLSSLKGTSRNYDRLTAEERARLILRANVRGDAGEQTRLHHAGVMIEIAIRDHTPAVLAFFDVAMLIRIELLETAGLFREMVAMEEQDDRLRDWRRRSRSYPRQDRPREPSIHPRRARARDLVRATGQLLRAKFHGWCLFCERVAVPAETGPPMGWDRLVRDVELAERLVQESTNGEEPKSILPTPMTAMQYADDAEALYRALRARWSGEDDDSGNPNSRPGVASSSTAMCR
jgi:hypothetical protein